MEDSEASGMDDDNSIPSSSSNLSCLSCTCYSCCPSLTSSNRLLGDLLHSLVSSTKTVLLHFVVLLSPPALVHSLINLLNR